MRGAIVEGFWEFARHFFAKNPRLGPPLKTFSVYQALRCGWPKLNGRIVLHDQGTPKVTGDSLLVKCGLSISSNLGPYSGANTPTPVWSRKVWPI